MNKNVSSLSRCRRALNRPPSARPGKFVAMLTGSSLLAVGALQAANTEDDVASGLATGADLTIGTSYTGGVAPTATSDVTFNPTNTYGAASYAIGTAATFGSFNDLSTTAITIQNGNSATQAPLTLMGGDTVTGSNPADLLYVASGANLTFKNTNTQSIVLGAAGNFDVAGTATFTAPIGGSFTLNKTGAGTLTLTSFNTFTGGTNVNAGTLALNAGGGTAAVQGAITVNTGATLSLTAGNALGYNAGSQVTTVNINGGTVSVVGALGDEGYLTSFNLTGGTLAYASSNTTNAYQIAAGATNAPGITSNASSTQSLISGGVNIRSGTLGIGVATGTTASGIDLQISGVISSGSTYGISKTGTGTLSLTAANTYTGTTTISAGTLELGNGGMTGTLVTTSAITDNGTLAFNRSNAVTQGTDFDGAAITGTGGVTQAGSGNTTLSGTNTYTGGTIVNAGTLTLNGGGSAGTVQGAITVNAGGTLSLTSGDALGYTSGTTVTTINVNGGTVTSTAGKNEGFYTSYSLTGGTVSAGALYRFNADVSTPLSIASFASGTTSTFAGTIDDFPNAGTTGNLVFNVAKGTTASGVDLLVSGVIENTGGAAGLAGITKTGAGNLSLSANNTFTGGTIVNGGTLTLSAGGGNAAVIGAVTVNTGTMLNLAHVDALGYNSATTTVTTVNVNGGTVNDTSGGNEGFLTSYNLTGGTLASTGGSYVFNTTATTPPTITSNASAATSMISGPLYLQNAGSLGFAVAKGTTASGTDLQISGVLTGAGGITKTGTGTMMLTATNVYTGATTVNAGSLFVSSTGSTATGSAVTVNGTGTLLGGTGTVGGAITVGNGAIISAGNSALATPATGTLTTGALTLQTGSTFNALLSSNASLSTLNAVGTTALGNAAFSISLTTGAAFTNNSVLQLITSNVTGTFTNSVYTVGGYNFAADYATDPGLFDVDVSMAAVPEPSTWVAGLLMLGAMGVSQRRKISLWLQTARV